MPLVARLRTSTTEIIGVLLPELQCPAQHGFIAEDDATSRHQFLDVAKAQGESEVQPNSVSNNFGWKEVTLVA